METLKNMPENARLWVYQSKTELTQDQIQLLLQKGKEFVNNWSAHGAALKASFDILYARFIVIAVDEKEAMASGCSIDKSVHFIKQLEQELHLDLFDRLHVAYRDENNKIKACSYTEFEKLAKEGKINENTIVFNNMVSNLSEFAKEWEVELKNSWQKRVFV